MKRTDRQYAEALYLATDNKDESFARQAVANLSTLLEKRGQSARLSGVLAAYESLVSEKQGVVRAAAVMATEPEPAVREALALIVKAFSGAAKVEVNIRLDKSILGGVILSYSDKLIDASLSGALNRLRMELNTR